MKIEAITLRELQIPLVHFFETSFGRTYARRVLLVTLHGDGIEGWGECVAGEYPYYSEEYVDGAWDVIVRYLGPSLLGKNLAAGNEVPALLSRVREHRMAKGALENAAWDAQAQEEGVPLWRLIGGSQREIDCGVSIGIQDSHAQLLQKIETELAAGYQRIKLKVKPGWDVEVLQKVRAQWPDILLSCDANSAYSLQDIEHLKTFDRFQLLMIEQPLWSDDFYFHARLQSALQTDVCLDEAIRSSRDAEAALELGACRIINIKVGRIGGFTDAIAVHDVAQRFGVPVWCGGMLESGIGRSHNVALSTLPNFKLPGDVSASKRYWKEDIIEPEVEVSPRGTISVSDKPGRGFQLRHDLIERLTVRRETLKASSA
jgi:o-succinylbenzoate synthase